MWAVKQQCKQINELVQVACKRLLGVQTGILACCQVTSYKRDSETNRLHYQGGLENLLASNLPQSMVLVSGMLVVTLGKLSVCNESLWQFTSKKGSCKCHVVMLQGLSKSKT